MVVVRSKEGVSATSIFRSERNDFDLGKDESLLSFPRSKSFPQSERARRRALVAIDELSVLIPDGSKMKEEGKEIGRDKIVQHRPLR